MEQDNNRASTSKPNLSSTTKPSDSKPTRPLYSSKLGDGKTRASENVNSSPTTRQPPIAQKAWASAKNPITGRSSQSPQQNNFNSAGNKQSSTVSTSSFREGQRVRIVLNTGAEFEGTYASNQADSASFSLRMVQQRKLPGDVANGTSKREQPSMSFMRKDVVEARPASGGGNPNKGEGKVQNGNRPGFRTDSNISSGRPSAERVLQPWVPDSAPDTDGSLEKSGPQGGKPWNQFEANERQFGLKTDYDENMYTTTINKAHPQYRERAAAADKLAREIERSVPTTSHVAEERVMDFAGGEEKGGDEEDKYSGVRRQDFPPLQNRENKYTPPARRAPTGQATAYGAPVDPAIISSQLKGGQAKKQSPQKADGAKSPLSASSNPPTPKPTDSKTAEPAPEANVDSKPAEAKAAEKAGDAKAPAATLRPSAATTARAVSPQGQGKTGGATPSATSTVEHDVLKEFRTFASMQRVQAEKVRSNKAKADAHVKLQELKKFADSFKLSTPVPSDLISIIAKDPAKQKQIQEKAMQNAEDIAKAKAAGREKDTAAAATPVAKDATAANATSTSTSAASATAAVTAAAATTTASTVAAPTRGPKDQQSSAGNAAMPHAASDNRHGGRPPAAQHTPSGNPRHQGGRQSYNNAQGGGYNNGQFRNDRSSGQYGPPQNRQGGGTLSERLRRVEQDRHSRQMPLQHMAQDQRAPPTGPANNIDPSYNRRLGSMPPVHMAAKLNPNSNEFRPSPFAATFNPNISGPSNGSSPRSINNIAAEPQPQPHPQPPLPPPPQPLSQPQPQVQPQPHPHPQPSAAPVGGQLIRRKTKAIDVKKCFILSHIKTIMPPQGRNWDENDGLRPSYDTLPTWRQLKDDEKSDSTMHMTYADYLDKMPYASTAMATPTPPHVAPQLAHQHQLPFHLQQGAHSMAPRQSPHIPPMHMHGGQQHGHAPHVSFGGGGVDDHTRMMHSNSAQSYASPRMAQVPIGYPPPTMGSPAQLPYQQGVMPPFMPSTPQMNNYRSFSNNPQYIPQQNSPMAMPVMPTQFLPAPSPLMQGGPQMPIYGGGHPQFVAAGGGAAPPQPIPGTNGYPTSPGRPAAAMMAQQGSQQGQPIYGVSPSMQFQQPVFPSQQHPGHMNMRGYNAAGPQQFGTSPSQMHQYGPQHRNGSNNYGGKNSNYQGHVPHQGPQQGHQVPTGPQGRSSDGPEEGK